MCASFFIFVNFNWFLLTFRWFCCYFDHFGEVIIFFRDNFVTFSLPVLFCLYAHFFLPDNEIGSICRLDQMKELNTHGMSILLWPFFSPVFFLLIV